VRGNLGNPPKKITWVKKKKKTPPTQKKKKNTWGKKKKKKDKKGVNPARISPHKVGFFFLEIEKTKRNKRQKPKKNPVDPLLGRH